MQFFETLLQDITLEVTEENSENIANKNIKKKKKSIPLDQQYKTWK